MSSLSAVAILLSMSSFLDSYLSLTEIKSILGSTNILRTRHTLFACGQRELGKGLLGGKSIPRHDDLSGELLTFKDAGVGVFVGPPLRFLSSIYTFFRLKPIAFRVIRCL